jgi:hypothetical protein
MSCFTVPSNIIKNFLTRLYDGKYFLKITIPPPAPPAPPPAPPPPPPPPADLVVDEAKTSCGCHLYEFKIFRSFYKDT